MDDDDDFFDMRQRIRIPGKRKRPENEKKSGEDGDDDDDSSCFPTFYQLANPVASDDSKVEEYVPARRT